MTSRVLLVRAARSTGGAGGGCCSGDVRPFDEGGSHTHDSAYDDVGAVYRAVRARLPADIAVEVVSPSNWLWLLPTLFADGRVLFSGALPDPDTAVAAVEAELAAR